MPSPRRSPYFGSWPYCHCTMVSSCQALGVSVTTVQCHARDAGLVPEGRGDFTRSGMDSLSVAIGPKSHSIKAPGGVFNQLVIFGRSDDAGPNSRRCRFSEPMK